MLEKPDIPEELIISHLQVEYGLRVEQIIFLPLGADMGTAVYRVLANDGTFYFLKLRKGFAEISVTVPLFLKSLGVQAIIATLEAKSKRGWADFGAYKMILYPYIDGQDGFERELTDAHRRVLGETLRGIHSAQLPLELKQYMPQETFSSHGRDTLKILMEKVTQESFTNPTADKLAAFMRSKREEITRLITRTEELAAEMQILPLDWVLCHSDIHGGNILLSDDGEIYVVDWDEPILAPKERDLMFIGGGIDAIWPTEQEESAFYEGYGKTEVNLSALAYFRYERIIQDLIVIGEQILLSDEGGADRERSLGWFTSNFEAGGTLEIAYKTDQARV